MDVLVTLAAAKGQIVSRQTLMDSVWKDVIVTDFALSRCIYLLRKSLGEVALADDSPIETLPKRGYRLKWAVEESSHRGHADAGKSVTTRWRARLAIAALLVVTGFAVWFALASRTETAERPAIAVLPFEDLSSNHSLEYFGDGMAQALLNELGHIRQMDVIARISSFGMRETAMNTGEISAALGVDYLVEGSVNMDADVVYVSAALIEARSGRQLWSDVFDHPVERSFSAQRDIATAIAGYLQVSLGDPHRRGGTDSFKAFEAYLRATGADDPDVASEFLDEALAYDPDYADALVARADIIYRRLRQGIRSEKDAWSVAQPLLARALAITDQLPYAYVLIGGFQIHLEDYEAAELALQRALEINPSDTEALVHLSRLMARMGRLDEAVVVAKRNVRLDPMNPKRHEQLADRLWVSGDIEAGKASFERSLELSAPHFGAWSHYAHRLADLETPLEGFRLVARLQRNPEFRARFNGPELGITPADVQTLGFWFGFIGDFAREREMLQLQSSMADSARLHRELAWALIGEGDLDEARREAWAALQGMPREAIVNFQVAYLALRAGEDMERVLAHYRTYWPNLFGDPEDAATVQKMVTIGAALIHRRLGNEDEALRLLELLQDPGPDPFAVAAMALAHLGNHAAALDVLEAHVGNGGYFNYIPGDPFWAPLAEESRFKAIVEDEGREAARLRAAVDRMVETGDLLLPGMQNSETLPQISGLHAF
jgi:TolB-like protein